MADTAPNGQKPVGSTTETCPLQQCTIIVQVLRQDNGEPMGGVDLTLRGPSPGTGQSATSNGLKDFAQVKKGSYQVEANLKGRQAELFEVPEPIRFSVSPGQEKVVIIKITRITEWVGIELVGEDGSPIPGEAYRVTLPDGTVKEGKLDSSGRARLNDLDPGQCQVEFPTLDKDAWEMLTR